MDEQRPPHSFAAKLHELQAHAARFLFLPEKKFSAVIADFQAEGTVGGSEGEPDLLALSVAQGVADGFLGNPEQVRGFEIVAQMDWNGTLKTAIDSEIGHRFREFFQ